MVKRHPADDIFIIIFKHEANMKPKKGFSFCMSHKENKKGVKI